MARPRKQTAGYFPHYVDEGKTKYILESKWGNDGYAFWFKLLEILCKNNGHFYDCSTPSNKMYLCAYMKLKEETVDEIIGSLIELGNIDRELWEKRQIIWCQNLVDNLQTLYAKRAEPTPRKPGLVEFTEQKPPVEVVSDAEPDISDAETVVSDAETPTEQPEEKPEKKPRKKKQEPEKTKYGEFVRMTEEEHQKLTEQYGPEKTARMIEVLDNYKGSKGKTYKNDYRAILSWVVDRVNEEFAKRGGSSYGGFNTDRRSAGTGDAGTGFRPSGGFQKGNE
ncbi:uncharacterized protein DUF4373 [Fusobacterium naviforme]|nr:uncharacterized protein DUF4373 [Fusobacterium naviforme]STO27631.1 Uncharacterised protein [Fusobacterium naviforme]